MFKGGFSNIKEYIIVTKKKLIENITIKINKNYHNRLLTILLLTFLLSPFFNWHVIFRIFRLVRRGVGR